MLRDHLGNARSGFRHTATGTASLRSDHYPFGLQYPQNILAGTPVNRYLYNGKELQDGLGIYDYGARLYDPVTARWNAVDPLAEGRPELTPYHYVSNSPVNRIDSDGRWDDDYRLGKDGRLTLLEETEDNFDIIYNSDKTQSLKVSKSEIVQDDHSTTLNFKNDLFSADRLYEFIAQNTSVEFAKIDGFYVDNMIENVSILTTTHQEGTVSTMGKMIVGLSNNGFVGRNISHTHPSGRQEPSGHYENVPGNPLSMMPIGFGSKKGDAANARVTQQWPGFRYTKFELYTPMHGTKTVYDGYNKARIVPVR